MSAYSSLAKWYDAFTGDVPYHALADYYEMLLRREGKDRMTLLDLGCGTGTLTLELAARGHELIGTDASPEMLAEAAAKARLGAYPVQPLFLAQGAAELDLYGTVEGAYCSLDAMNYLSPEEIPEALRRLHLFLEPGGIFAFDLHSPEHLRELDGQMFVDENDDALCLWRADFDGEENALVYGMDIFSRHGALWRREAEEHVEYAHAPSWLKGALEKAGFANVSVRQDGPQHEMGRLFFRAVNLPH
ncbi:MAG: class I SAM-dependent methyltransferase [Oscillospiraceae bacterium]|nr:class I SAM-dependent methyltransferase [Oscillospiraceae bacterium]